MTVLCTLILLLKASLTTVTATRSAHHYAGPHSVPPHKNCKCFPGDTCWPTPMEWHVFNKTIAGRLVATVPLAAPCHDNAWSTYDNATCTTLQNGWLEPENHYDSSSSIMAPFFANRSCDPFLPRDSQCVIGTYVQYAINVSCAEDVAAGIRFARERNIRLVIRNTGHDYNGKSTGSGALGLWMHHLKDISIEDYSGATYTGKVIKMGAGVQGFEAYAKANASGLQVAGGECPTVGLAGGYAQGGGHSALSSRHGLAADQALEWEVITANGDHIHATAHNEHSDLYWALSGGGGGTYGVVLSLTAKAHPDTPISAMNLTFTSANTTQDAYYSTIATFHALLPALVDAGATPIWYFTNTSFTISPLIAPCLHLPTLKHHLAPLESHLRALHIPYTSHYAHFPTYLTAFNTIFHPIDVGIAQYGGRLIPRSVVQNNNSALTTAYREINAIANAQFIGVGVNVPIPKDVNNSVHPAWRTALIDTVITTPWNFTAPWEDMLTNQRIMTDMLIPKLDSFGKGCYLNEGDFREPKWQEVFYGSNYDRLREIKEKYDPEGLFWAGTAVGSEKWVAVDETGKLCRA